LKASTNTATSGSSRKLAKNVSEMAMTIHFTSGESDAAGLASKRAARANGAA
jgi:hypothetical protein